MSHMLEHKLIVRLKIVFKRDIKEAWGTLEKPQKFLDSLQRLRNSRRKESVGTEKHSEE